MDRLDRRVAKYRGLLRGNPLFAWDLDSTICRTIRRRYLIEDIETGKASWDDYSMLCGTDEPIEGTVALMRRLKTLRTETKHIAISGRSDDALVITTRWAEQHSVPLDALFLRPAGDSMPTGEWKVLVLRKLKEAGISVWLFFDDWASAAEHVRQETGIPVVGINPFEPCPSCGMKADSPITGSL